MQIQWTSKAFRQLSKIKEKDTKNKIYDSVTELKTWPAPEMDIKKLVNREGYRLRVGRWRVIFDVFNEVKIVEIQEVLKRDEHTY